jgi:prevent-host-death family protein
MNKVGAYEAKTHLPSLLARVARGEQFVITRHGVPVAKLIPIGGEADVDAGEVIRQIREIGRQHSLGGLTYRELIDEGRRR